MSDPNNALSQVLAALAANAQNPNAPAASSNSTDATAPAASVPTTSAAPVTTPALNSLLPLLSSSSTLGQNGQDGQNASNDLPAPDSTGHVGVPTENDVKPANTGLVSIADAIAKAREFAAEQGISGAQKKESVPFISHATPPRSPPPQPARRVQYRDNYNPYRDERRQDRNGSMQDRGYGRDRKDRERGRDRSFSPRGGRGRYSGSSISEWDYQPHDHQQQQHHPQNRRQSPDRAYGNNSINNGNGNWSKDEDEKDGMETISVEISLVGLVIGRQGDTLRRIQTDTGSRVHFLDPDPNNNIRACKIIGAPSARRSAKAEITRIISEHVTGSSRGGNGNYGTAGAGSYGSNPNFDSERNASHSDPGGRFGGFPRDDGDEDNMQIMVPDKTVGLIIGRGGDNIRVLQDRSGCRVNIVSENRSVNGFRPVNLKGTKDAQYRARDLILEIVENDPRASNSGYQNVIGSNGGSGDATGNGFNNMGDGFDKSMENISVPSDAVGMIIGKGGESIKDMQNTTGCKINIFQSVPREVDRRVSLTGSKKSIEQAKLAIQDKVHAAQQNRNQPAFRSYNNNNNDQFQNDYQNDNNNNQYMPHPSQPLPSYSQQSSVDYGQQGMGMADTNVSSTAAATISDTSQGATNPYAAYGGYQNYVAWWYAAMAAQQQGASQDQQPQDGQQQQQQESAPQQQAFDFSSSYGQMGMYGAPGAQ